MNIARNFTSPALFEKLQLIVLAAVTIFAAHFTSEMVASAWYVVLLIQYARSKNEVFWFVFFFITTDGFFGFLGLYSTVIKAVPGLPGIEICQFYIIISLVKVLKSKIRPKIFFNHWLILMAVYCVFLIGFGMIIGLKADLSIYFKIFKTIFPLLLFYTVPRLIYTVEANERLFNLFFMVAMLALIAQLMTLFTGFDPKIYTQKVESSDLETQIEVGRNFRVLYSTNAVIISLFGALYMLALRKRHLFTDGYLYVLIMACFVVAFLSATRGWIISFSFIIILSLMVIQKVKKNHLLVLTAIIIVGVVAGMFNKKINTQIQYSIARLFTLNSLAEGDKTAGGTLIRLTERSPRVMKVWRTSPVFGVGFSDDYMEHADGHVANQNILMHSGIVGFAIMILFFLTFCIKMSFTYVNLPETNNYKKTFPVFVIFLLGWFIIHSTSGQQFAYYGLPAQIFPVALFFNLGAITYGVRNVPVG
ncbi:MAG: hypothetical protein HY252_19780 [Sphingobacteriales bacterium]|nr:hypothetical protein [Sphingobacteriales bacterium]